MEYISQISQHIFPYKMKEVREEEKWDLLFGSASLI